MSEQLPPQLSGPQGSPVPGGLADQMYAQPDQQDQSQDGGLSVLQDCIEAISHLLTALHDPNDVNQAAGALKALTNIQMRLMAQSGPSA